MNGSVGAWDVYRGSVLYLVYICELHSHITFMHCELLCSMALPKSNAVEHLEEKRKFSRQASTVCNLVLQRARHLMSAQDKQGPRLFSSPARIKKKRPPVYTAVDIACGMKI